MCEKSCRANSCPHCMVVMVDSSSSSKQHRRNQDKRRKTQEAQINSPEIRPTKIWQIYCIIEGYVIMWEVQLHAIVYYIIIDNVPRLYIYVGQAIHRWWDWRKLLRLRAYFRGPSCSVAYRNISQRQIWWIHHFWWNGPRAVASCVHTYSLTIFCLSTWSSTVSISYLPAYT